MFFQSGPEPGRAASGSLQADVRGALAMQESHGSDLSGTHGDIVKLIQVFVLLLEHGLCGALVTVCNVCVW